MSVNYYGKLWIATAEDLKDLRIREKFIQQTPPTLNKQNVHRIFASLYARYVTLVNNLNELFDQTCQVQKRKIIENLLIPATARLFELQNEIKQIDLSQFIYVDQTLVELKLIPQDIQLIKPFPRRRTKEIEDILYEYKKLSYKTSDLSTLDAINLIKKHEKARKGRLFLTNIKALPDIYTPKPPDIPMVIPYEFFHKTDQIMLLPIRRTNYNKDFYKDKKFVEESGYKIPERKTEVKFQGPKRRDSKSKLLEKNHKNNAARLIQRNWFKYKTEKSNQELKRKKLLLLGMIDDRKWDFSLQRKLQNLSESHRKLKPMFDEQFVQACFDEKSKILKLKSPWIMEDISDEIRDWLREWYDTVDNFDKYPSSLKGGTILLVRGETLTIPEYIELEKQKEIDAKKSDESKKQEAEAKKELKERKKEQRIALKLKNKELKLAKKLLEEKEGRTYEFDQKEFITPAYIKLETTMEEYEREWTFIDEGKNLKEFPYMDFITIDQYSDVHKELHTIVDEFMKIEYELLKMALASDQKTKYKVQKERKKKNKKRKQKKIKDLTKDRTIESIFQELLENEVIRVYEKKSLNDFVGDLKYSGYEFKNILDKHSIHFTGEIKYLLRSFIQGMGQVQLPKPKSIGIIGPPKTGKKLLVEIICSELDAVMFDISPENVYKFQDINYFLHLITKMSRILQPSILFIDGAHKPFYKKIPENEVIYDPKRIGKYIIKKIVKPIKQSEKIMLIGTSNEPWNCQLGKFKKCYTNFIFVPPTDYNTRFLLWKSELEKNFGVPRDFSIFPLALMSEGYSPGQIAENVKKIVDIRRRMNFSRKELTLKELLEGFLSEELPFPLEQRDFDKYTKLYEKIDKLAKQRAVVLAAQAEARRIQEEKDKKKNK